jgi:hypothetical protein
VTRLERVLSGQGRDRVSHRPVPSVPHQRPKLTDSQRSEIVRLYLAGESASALAPEFGVHVSTLVEHLRRAGIVVRQRVIVRIDIDEAARLYASGLSLSRVGTALGVSAGTILNEFRSAGLSTRPVGTNQFG